MKTPPWDSLSPTTQDRVQCYLDGTITEDEFSRLQDEMAESSRLRRFVRRAITIDQFLSEESEKTASQNVFEPWLTNSPNKPSDGSTPILLSRFPKSPKLWPVALAAVLAFGCGLFLMSLRQDATAPKVGSAPEFASSSPGLADGFAVMQKLLGTKWSGSTYQEGDALGAGTITLTSGLAQIQFYSGATMTIEGPARIELKSAWEAYCYEGAVRMRVPPAARGFRLNAPDTQIIDLGTEFGMNVSDGQGHVEVFDGEIALSHRGGDKKILERGDTLQFNGSNSSPGQRQAPIHYPDADKFVKRVAEQENSGFQKWQQERDRIAGDKRIAAYFTFEKKDQFGLFPNLRDSSDYNLNAAPILAETVPGRWPHLKKAVEFRRPDARVRLHVDNDFEGFTFMSWVRIDSLDRDYNALFMADGYENGEPHWQIRRGGRMMLSVMVDDSRPSIYPNDVSGYHYVYFSPQMWHQKLSGQWLHLASTYDPVRAQVAHYVNGKRISLETIKPEWQPPQLKIGNCEIGNWGQANREDSKYAIRSINGSIGEITIFRQALPPQEIKSFYKRTRAK